MKRRIVEWYNRNREKIVILFICIAVIVGVNLLIVYLSNRIAKEKQENEVLQIEQENSLRSEFNSLSISSEESVLDDQQLTNFQQTMLKTLEKFVDYCNNGDIEGAYNLISDECKQEMYKTIEDFKTGYYNIVFNGESKSISVENWTANIYKVNFQPNYLALGNYTKGNIIQDYIQIVTDENGEHKLNINKYIGKEKIQKETTRNNLTIHITEVSRHMDYEIYKVKIINNSNSTVMLCDENNKNSIYLLDDNNLQYSVYTHEIAEASLKISPTETKEIELKFYNKYGTEKTIENIVFSKVILNLEEYENIEDKSQYEGFSYIQISI